MCVWVKNCFVCVREFLFCFCFSSGIFLAPCCVGDVPMEEDEREKTTTTTRVWTCARSADCDGNTGEEVLTSQLVMVSTQLHSVQCLLRGET